EKSFEQSELYFKSHYLNPFGVGRFRDVVTGMIGDPFLDLHLNPANLPDLAEGKTYFSLDFRGDREEPEVMTSYILPGFYIDYWQPYRDPRWHSIARTEPEPFLAMGLLRYILNDKLLLGGTYQLIYKNEKFYSMPYAIYNWRYGYDTFGAGSLEEGEIPVEDVYSGQDEMTNRGHLFSLFVGSKLSPKIHAGLSLNGVVHSREGSYIDSRSEEYGNTNNYDWKSYGGKERDQDYNHLDFSGGIRYFFDPDNSVGLKVGYLNGEADQSYLSADSSRYNRTDQNVDSYSHDSYNRAITDQSWNRDGKSLYGTVHFNRRIDEKKKFRGYYSFTSGNVDLASETAINDTSFYTGSGHYSWNNTDYMYLNRSLTADRRFSTGSREQTIHEINLNMEWKLSARNTVMAGIYFAQNKYTISSSEPVIAERWSDNFRQETSGGSTTDYAYYRRTYEDKRLEWQYESKNLSIQVPILLSLKLNKNMNMILGVNRILDNWDIYEQTTAYFTQRVRTEDGQTKEETNFGERYTQPHQKITEDYTDFITRFEVAVSPDLKLNLLI
ncbi:MAG: hypothetical protein GY839_17945, partial [candidate division Zixibacteria bacterium]|nr:hypothetical protein [candidate division Zixibacteria bacterium]